MRQLAMKYFLSLNRVFSQVYCCCFFNRILTEVFFILWVRGYIKVIADNRIILLIYQGRHRHIKDTRVYIGCYRL